MKYSFLVAFIEKHVYFNMKMVMKNIELRERTTYKGSKTTEVGYYY